MKKPTMRALPEPFSPRHYAQRRRRLTRSVWLGALLVLGAMCPPPIAAQTAPQPFEPPAEMRAAATEAFAGATADDATLSCTASCSGVFCVQPYLQNLRYVPASGTNSVSVLMQTNGSPSQTPQVSYAAGSCASFSNPTRVNAVVQRMSGGPANVWKADLSGLAAGTLYCYQATVQGAGGVLRSFTSLEAPPATFSFYVYGDTRAGSACYTSNAPHQLVVDAMSTASNLAGVRFIVNSGDFVYSGNCQQDWFVQYFDQAGPMLASLPIFTAPGNHELYDCARGSHCSLSGCASGTAGTYFQTYFSPHTTNASYFDYGNSRFIALNLTSTDGSSGLITDQLSSSTMNWLTTTLSAAESDLKIDHVFLYYHAPMLTLGASTNEHPCSDWQIGHLAPLYEKSSKVRAIFNGHTHYYQRSSALTGVSLTPGQHCGRASTPIQYTRNPGGGVSYVVAGAGGAGPSTPGSAGWVAAATSEHGFLKVTVSGRAAYAEQIGVGSYRDPFPLTLGITGGVEHNCVLTARGGAQCWGANQAGQVGNPAAPNPQTAPIAVVDGAGTPVSGLGQIAAGEYHTCAVSAASYASGGIEYPGTLLCWGTNGSGQIGNGTSGGKVRYASRVVTGSAGVPLGQVTQAAAGYSSTCARLADGTARCWGNGQYGQLGNGVIADQAYPYPGAVLDAHGQPLRGIAQVSVGQYHACALMNGGTVKCWGENASGQLGYSTGNPAGASAIPGTVVLAGGAPLTDVVQITASAYNTCAVLRNGSVWCWGLNTYGRLGNGPGGVVPSQVAGIANVVDIETNWTSTCALVQGITNQAADNSAHCWGHNVQGQLGNTTAGGGTPTQVGALSGLTALSVSAYGGCAVDDQSRVWCWGGNAYGQLGNGTSGGFSTAPVSIAITLAD